MPLATRHGIELGELADEDWVSWPAGQLCHDWLARTMPGLRITHTASDHSTRLALVAAGLGIALIPRLGRDPVASGVRFVAVSPAPIRRVHAVWRAGTARHPAVKATLTALREAATGRGSRSATPGRTALAYQERRNVLVLEDRLSVAAGQRGGSDG